MSEHKTVTLRKEEALTVNLSDAACRVVLKYEKKCNSQEPVSSEEKFLDDVKQVPKYKENSDFNDSLQRDQNPKGKRKVFISYNSKDIVEVGQIVQKLEKNSHVIAWTDKKDILPGDFIQEKLQEAVLEAECVLIFIGPNDSGPFQRLELSSFVDRGCKENVRVIPLLLPGIDEIPQHLVFLRQWEWVHFTRMDDEVAFNRLTTGITAVKSPQKRKRR